MLFYSCAYASNLSEDNFLVKKASKIYLVKGDSVEDVHSSMNNGMIDSSDAEVVANIAFNLSYQTAVGTCDLLWFETEIEYYVPQYDGVLDERKKDIYRFIDDVYTHEEVHCSIYLKYADMMYSELVKYSNTNGTCDKEPENVTQLFYKAKKENVLFDEISNFGQLEIDVSKFESSEYMKYCNVPNEIATGAK
jgi:predicted secreted Zn-dependent protease